jgi:hypothetical protein
MPKVARYRIRFYGSSDGFEDSRARITLYKSQTLRSQDILGFISFHDLGMTFHDDAKVGNIIIMHLPSAMLANVLDVLRNEKPIDFSFEAGHAFLGTSAEPVGEAE